MACWHSTWRGLSRSLCAVAVLAAVTVAAPTPAQATGQGEWVVAPQLGFAVQRDDDGTWYGAGLHLDARYGFTDVVGLRLQGRYAVFPSLGPGGPSAVHSTGLGLGVTFSFDMFQAIPFFTLGVGGAYVHEQGGFDSFWNAELRAGFGADWLVRRDFSVGFEFVYALLVPDVKRFPYFFALNLRLAWRHD